MRHRPAGFDIRSATLDGLENVQMVLHVFQAAVIGQSVEKISDGLFRLHLCTSPAWDLDRVYARSVEFGIPVLKTERLALLHVGLTLN